MMRFDFQLTPSFLACFVPKRGSQVSRLLQAGIFCCPISFLLVACDSSPRQEVPAPFSEANLRNVGQAYFNATQAYKKPPASARDLAGFIKGDPDKVFRSEND